MLRFGLSLLLFCFSLHVVVNDALQQMEYTCDPLPSEVFEINMCGTRSTYSLVLPYGDCGVQLNSPEEAVEAPHVTFEQAEDGALYTLMMIDLDVNFLHWLAYNISAESLRGGYDGIDDGDDLTYMEYFGPAPPAGSGLHHYLFVLLRQGESPQMELSPPESRGHFNVQGFLEDMAECPSFTALYEYTAQET